MQKTQSNIKRNLLTYCDFVISLGKTRAAVIVATPISAAFLLVCGLTMFFRIRNHSNQSDAEDPKKKLEKTFSARSMNVRSIAELESHYLRNKKREGERDYLSCHFFFF